MLNLAASSMLSTPLFSVFVTSVVVMLGDLFFPKNQRITVFALIGIMVAFFFCIRLFPLNSTTMWGNQFIGDNATFLMQTFILGSVALCIFYASSRLKNLESSRGDVLSLYLFSTIGMMLLVASNTMLSLYMSLELTSLPLYALVASERHHGKSVEAAVKFFVMGAIASSFILFGMSLLYGVSGTLDFASIASFLKNPNTNLMVLFGMIFIISGAAFKLALVPFHMWAPDVYVGANPVMTLFLSAAPKIAGLGIFLRLSMAGLFDVLPQIHIVLAVIAIISILLGNLTAMVQTDLRRLLAYSTIAHMGYVILGMVGGGKAGQAASLFYILVYAVMTIIAFATVLISKDENGYVYHVADLKGLSKRSPWLAAMLLIVFLSMAGIPPTVGFLAKFLIIRSVVDAGFYVVAFLALIFAVFGAFYYLSLIKNMYFEKPDQDEQPINVAFSHKVIFVIQSLLLLVLGVLPDLLMSACIQ
ncbi:MAG: NADH-quinone oxidoreductase subunit N [Gammaproteobacteria bacterium]|nr:NADH-quinone oxidoreductase subunit N [Gammaproteobacteria bacterium]